MKPGLYTRMCEVGTQVRGERIASCSVTSGHQAAAHIIFDLLLHPCVGIVY